MTKLSVSPPHAADARLADLVRRLVLVTCYAALLVIAVPQRVEAETWTFCANENSVCSFTGTKQVRYGLNGVFSTGVFTNGVGCSNGVFGDPLPGADKICEYASASAWTFCANENAVCSFTGTKQVRYGLGNTFVVRTFSGGIGCSNGVFGDPLVGADKKCEYAVANTVQLENAKTPAQGVTGDWLIAEASYATNHEIEGYASATSVGRGQSISLFVNTSSATYTLDVYRIGWYGGAGGRRVHGPVRLSGVNQPACSTVDPATYLVECNWTNPYVLSIPASTDPTDWASGFYLAKLTDANGKGSYIVFVVRDDNRGADLMFQSAVTTYAGYNRWGGYGFYSEPNARKVSFNRPYAKNREVAHPAVGSGDFFGWEIYMVRFLEKEGYDVTYSTNIDTHTSGDRLTRYRAMLSVGHDEYWTKAMRDAVERARDQGVNLGFFGANASYWQVRLEPSSTGQPNRTVVGYRYASDADPFRTTRPTETTTLWRDPIVGRPEAAMIGVQYAFNSLDGDMIIDNCAIWICENTGLTRGSRLRGMLGYEVDGVDASSPPGITILAKSPYVCTFCPGNPTQESNMTYYTARSGAGVFATGSMNWNFGLDAFGPFVDRTNPAVQQMTRNVLNRFVGRVPIN